MKRLLAWFAGTAVAALLVDAVLHHEAEKARKAKPRRDLFDDPVTDSEWAEIFRDSDGIGTDDVDLAAAQWLHLTPAQQHAEVRKSASALTAEQRAELQGWFPLPPEADAGSHS